MPQALQQRAQAFLLRPVPKGLDYVSGSITERVIAAYAERGTVGLDEELRELLELCVMETEDAAASASAEVRAYFEESVAILKTIAAGS